ncbi:MAG: O-antigen ligase family protein [Candidatus Krumholzibacteriia bacterium]
MRALQHVADTLLDFVENTRLGSGGFRLARLALFGMIILVAGKFAAARFLRLSFDDVFFMATTGMVFMIVFWRWEIGAILVLCTTSFIMYYHVLPTISLYHFVPEIKILEHLRLQVGQGLILYLLALFATSLEVRKARERLATPLAPAMLVFLLALLTAAIIGVVFKGVHMKSMVETARPYSFYLLFFVILLCIRSRRELGIFLTAAYVMALIVAVLMGVQFALGERAKIFIGGGIRVHSFGTYAGRILPPGVELIWLCVPFVIARIPLVSGRAQKWLVLSLGLLLGGLLLTFTRTVWMAVLLSMGVMAILGRGAIRRSVLRMFLAMGGFVVVILLLLTLLSTERENYVAPYIARFSSIFELESYEEGTTAYARWDEIKEAWPHIVQNPWFGVGIGGTYRFREAWDDYGKQHYLQAVSYIHNAYVLLLTHAGAVGFTACMAVYLIFFVRARKILRVVRSETDRALIMAGIGAVASVMLASMMQPSMWYPPAVALVGTIFGLVELLRYFHQEETRKREIEDAVAQARRHRLQRARPSSRLVT